jgi:DNA-directed RNA polymerase I, II, and III subunit RPABC1
MTTLGGPINMVQLTQGLNSSAARLFRIRKTCFALLHKRGYNVPVDDLEMSAETFLARFGDFPGRENLTILVAKQDDADNRMFVFFPESDVGVPQCKTYAQRMRDDSVRSAILVINGKFSNFAKLSLAELSPALSIEHFRDEELMVDITEHELVPKHQLLTPQEKAALLERYKLKESQLPRIQMGDPIARFYGLKRGEVVKIVRPSETAGRYVTYRIVM